MSLQCNYCVGEELEKQRQKLGKAVIAVVKNKAGFPTSIVLEKVIAIFTANREEIAKEETPEEATFESVHQIMKDSWR